MGRHQGQRPPNRLVRVVLILAVVACIGAEWATDWEAITAATAGVRTIQGDFIQEKHLSILNRPLISEGRFIFEKPDALRWEYISPVKSLMLTAEGRTRLYIESGGRLVENSGASTQVLPMVMEEITRWLGGRFSESADFDAVLVAGEKIILSPRTGALAQMIQRIELTFDDTPGAIHTVTIVEGRESATILRFGDLHLNLTVPGKLFREP